MGRRLGRGAVLCALPLLATLARQAAAQTALSLVSGGTVTFPAPTGADYAAGAIVATSGIAFQVDASTGNAKQQRTTTVSIRATAPTLGGYGKPVSDLQWSVGSPAGPWTPLTTSDVVVESRPVQKKRLNDPWTDTIYLRVLVSWLNDPPGTYASGLVITLTTTSP